MMNTNLLAEKAAAEYIGVSVSTLKRKRYGHEIGWFKVGTRIRYSIAKHLDVYLDKCEQKVEGGDLGLEP
jgi:hypothetical protein